MVASWLALCGAGCDRVEEPPPDPMSLVAYDPLPADMGAWSCVDYLQALEGTPHATTLAALLELRPHRFRHPADPRDLVELDDALVLESRRNRPIYRHLLHPDVVDSLAKLIAAADAAGIILRVQSAYRTASYQNLLWKQAVSRYHSDLSRAAFALAPPCFSEHATGRSLDFDTGGAGNHFTDSAEYHWLHDNAGRWGWVQSFRPDTGAVRSARERGVLIEPWHFHHVSLDDASTTDLE